MTNTVATPYTAPYAHDAVDASGDAFGELPPYGPCEGRYPDCAEVGERTICPLDFEYHDSSRWAYLCEGCYEQRRRDV